MKVLLTTRMVRRKECKWLDDDIDEGTLLYFDETIPPNNLYVYVMYAPGTTSFQFPINAIELYGESAV